MVLCNRFEGYSCARKCPVTKSQPIPNSSSNSLLFGQVDKNFSSIATYQ